MVYINTLNAFLGVGLILLLSTFIIFVGFLWIDNLQETASEEMYEQIEDQECNCIDIISDNNKQIVIMNVNCDYVEDLTVYIGQDVYKINKTLYFEDFTVINYDFEPSFFNFTYNSCQEIINK